MCLSASLGSASGYSNVAEVDRMSGDDSTSVPSVHKSAFQRQNRKKSDAVDCQMLFLMRVIILYERIHSILTDVLR
jgi:hypothetical protein